VVRVLGDILGLQRSPDGIHLCSPKVELSNLGSAANLGCPGPGQQRRSSYVSASRLHDEHRPDRGAFRGEGAIFWAEYRQRGTIGTVNTLNRVLPVKSIPVQGQVSRVLKSRARNVARSNSSGEVDSALRRHLLLISMLSDELAPRLAGGVLGAGRGPSAWLVELSSTP
jgi:hypothetical protein